MLLPLRGIRRPSDKAGADLRYPFLRHSIEKKRRLADYGRCIGLECTYICAFMKTTF